MLHSWGKEFTSICFPAEALAFCLKWAWHRMKGQRNSSILMPLAGGIYLQETCNSVGSASDLPRTSIGLMMKLLSSEMPDIRTEIQRWSLNFLEGRSHIWMLGVIRGRWPQSFVPSSFLSSTLNLLQCGLAIQTAQAGRAAAAGQGCVHEDWTGV